MREPKPLYEKAIDWSRKYGDPFTVWIGNRPFVMASTKESFTEISGPLRNLVADRTISQLGELQKRGHDVSHNRMGFVGAHEYVDSSGPIFPIGISDRRGGNLIVKLVAGRHKQ